MVMKNTQLRNGNKVLHDRKVKTIDGVVRGHVCFVEEVTKQFEQDVYGPWVDLDEVEFVPLSDEILLKCGFVEDEPYLELTVNNLITLDWYQYIFDPENKFGICAKHQRSSLDIKYLHQLQNLYFSLTNKELNTEL